MRRLLQRSFVSCRITLRAFFLRIPMGSAYERSCSVDADRIPTCLFKVLLMFQYEKVTLQRGSFLVHTAGLIGAWDSMCAALVVG
jgi:hypothetical protein